MTRVVLDQAALAALASDPQVLAVVRAQVAEPLAEDMRAAAPKRTGAGAASIHVEDDPDGRGLRVSWDRKHFYMGFRDLGTRFQRGWHFAERAARRFGSR